jgi:fructuronate reductase
LSGAPALLPVLSAESGYDRARVTPGIVHLGIGAFCRAHIAFYVDEVLKVDPSWGIIGASLRRSATRDALAAQDFLYTLVVRSAGATETRVIGSVLNIFDAATQRDALLAAMADPQIRIVSLTITEKGYCHDPATGELDPVHPDIAHDLTHPDAPTSAPGLIVCALKRRFEAGVDPFTVLCCDNLPANGETTARVVRQFAALIDPMLSRRIAREVAFPSTMVDRIVPATTDEDRKFVFETAGFLDAWPVMTEPFTQWVIEDRFSNGRPPFERFGAQLVSDVRPFETMKLRMLNGSHSILAYLGYLAGYEFISDAIADPALHALIHDFMTHEVPSTLSQGRDELAAYRDALLARFLNPALRHRAWQIAMDGSQKLPQRLLGTIRHRLAEKAPFPRAALGVAAWMRYVSGTDEQGRPIDVRDPMADRLRFPVNSAISPDQLADRVLRIRDIFGDDLPRSEPFRAEVVSQLTSLVERGALETVRRLNAQYS